MTKLYSTNRSFFKEFLEFLLEVNYGHRITQTVTLFSNNHDLFYQLFLICLDWTLSHIKYEKIRMNKKLIFVFCTWLGIHTLLLNENIWFFHQETGERTVFWKFSITIIDFIWLVVKNWFHWMDLGSNWCEIHNISYCNATCTGRIWPSLRTLLKITDRVIYILDFHLKAFISDIAWRQHFEKTSKRLEF